ncbi:hypothetical protein CHS0354_023835 [Potamilus streckersoni]|uniref:Cytosol aminopeptidase n=1 Tax=Potamilus streckersoni TaxID=2493646 RepID=A0AAE0RZ59_9BIVA|nr:hypothetical protein CHS0354_023835 [Potamilus streckersoni]
MNVNISTQVFLNSPTEIIGFFINQKDKVNQLGRIESHLQIRLGEFGSDFKAKEGDVSVFYTLNQITPRVALIGTGEASTLDVLREAVGAYASHVKKLKLEKVSLDLTSLNELSVQASDTVSYTFQTIIEGFLMAFYEYDRFKTENSDTSERDNALKAMDMYQKVSFTAHLKNSMQAKVEQSIEVAKAIVQSQFNVRDLVNAPSNHLSATDLSKYIQNSAKKSGYKAVVFDKQKIIEMNFGGLIAVNKGSVEPPTFNILEYKSGKARLKVALIGKGVTFDTGGISIKPSQGMGEMKADMAGAAAVIGALEAASQLKLPLHIFGVIPATDNKPSGSAQNPGDVITTYSGITVEVDNTDAEGRLILADAIAYTKKVIRPDIMIDLATLTGACVVALGHHAAGLFSNNEDIVTKLFNAGIRSGEKVWRLPLWKEYGKQITSTIADVKNTGTGGAGAVTAAKFLEKFTGEHTAWAHLDIAGTAIPKFTNSSGNGGGQALPGFGVRLLIEFMSQL